MFLDLLTSHLDDVETVVRAPSIWQIVGGIVLLSPLVAITLVILDESGRPAPRARRAPAPSKRSRR
jgi:hypothetical protein